VGRPQPPPQPASLGGNRDFIIRIECTAKAAIIHPQNLRIATESLSPGNTGVGLLQQTLQRIISRRQAAVRPGELPYRPQIRLLVRPDALRTLHLVYPILEPLGVPLTRHNLDADAEVGTE
jgi:hypothetical protein